MLHSTMKTPYEEVIADLEVQADHLRQQLAQVQGLIASLRQFAPSVNGAETAPEGPDLFADSDFPKLTVQEAVDAILASEDALTVREIRRRSEAMGKHLKDGSVRWTLANGITAGKYRKDTSGKVNRFELVFDRKEGEEGA